MRSSPARPASLRIRAAARVIRRLPAGRHRVARWVARSVGEPFWAELPPQLGSMTFRCDLRDGLMREAYLTGRYEPQETAIIRDLVRPGMTFADVGANWGYFTLVAAHLAGPSGRVISVEADARAVAAIRANVAANRLTTVRVFDIAATDVPRDLSFERYEPVRASASGNFGLAETASAPDGRRPRVVVRGRPLDDVFDEAGVPHVDVLKMDIEGGEAAALRGLERYLSSGRIDFIVLELHPAALDRLGTSAAAVCDHLSAAGYEGWRIHHSPTTHYRAALPAVDITTLLSPLRAGSDLGVWPHVLWRRRGL